MCLNETYSRVWVGKQLSDMLPAKSGLKKRRYYITIACQICCNACHEEDSGKTGGLVIKWYTSTLGLCMLMMLTL